MNRWQTVGLSSAGQTVEVTAGLGRRPQVTLRAARKALRASGINPLVQGYIGHTLSVEHDDEGNLLTTCGLAIATAAAKSPKDFERKFERMAARRKAERAELKRIHFNF